MTMVKISTKGDRCDICGRVFAWASDFQPHAWRHFEELCWARFYSNLDDVGPTKAEHESHARMIRDRARAMLPACRERN